MKIAFVSDRPYPFFKGGAEKRYWEIARWLVEDGHEAQFYTGQWPGMARSMIIDGIKLRSVYEVGNFYVNGRKSVVESILYAVKLLPHLLAGSFDAIECDQFPLLTIFTSKLVSVLKKKPLVVTWHEVWGKKQWVRYLGGLGMIGALIERLAVRLPDHIVSVSRRTTRNLSHVLGVRISRVSTIPNGINMNWD